MKNTLILLVGLLLASCTSSSEKAKAPNAGTEESDQQIAVPAPAVAEDLSAHPGLSLYNQHCIACHQTDGSGVPGMFPPIIETKWVDGENAVLIDIVIHGIEGEIDVNGEYYNLPMVPIPGLSDQEVADLLNYVRKAFGSSEVEITAGEVEARREAGSKVVGG